VLLQVTSDIRKKAEAAFADNKQHRDSKSDRNLQIRLQKIKAMKEKKLEYKKSKEKSSVEEVLLAFFSVVKKCSELRSPTSCVRITMQRIE